MLSGDRNFKLDDIILNPVDYAFIDAHFIGEAVKRQAVRSGIVSNAGFF